jgi:drug/metabolite transporter (DMT)-like permease
MAPTMNSLNPFAPGFAGPSATPGPAAGWMTMGLTLVIWAGFSLSIRAIGASTLTPSDVALIRFLVPAIVLAPFVASRLAALRALPLRCWAMIAVGAGLPFFLVASLGGRFTSASHVSALIAGTTPLSFSIAGWLFWREAVPAARMKRLAVIVAGVLLMVAGFATHSPQALAGMGVLLLASLLWGTYTQGLRVAGLDPLAGVMVVTYPSLLLLAGLEGTGLLESHLRAAPLRELLVFAGVQGVGVGIFSTLLYGLSVRLLGAQKCSMVGALAPVLATVLAVPLLGEHPSALSACGLVMVSLGVMLSVRAQAPAVR